MAGAIYCGFARVAVHVHIQRHTSSNNQLLPRWKENVISDYNSDFRGYSRMLLPTDPKNVSKRIISLRECFGRRWNPANTKVEYFRTFSLDAWNSLSQQSKQQHSLQSCTACDCNYSLQMSYFPVRSKAIKRKSPVSKAVEEQVKKIRLSQQITPTSSKRALGRRILGELNPICKESVGFDLCAVLTSTPEAAVQRKKPKKEIKKEHSQLLSMAKSTMQQHFASQDSQLVYGNWLSYSKYQTIRIAESYKPKVENHSCQNESQSEKRHGFEKHNYLFDEERLLPEAKTWSSNTEINWTKLGTDMPLTCANRRQVVKEFLAKTASLPL